MDRRATGSPIRPARRPAARRVSTGCSFPAASACAASRAWSRRSAGRGRTACRSSASASACRWRSSSSPATSAACPTTNSTEFEPDCADAGHRADGVAAHVTDMGGTMRLGAYTAPAPARLARGAGLRDQRDQRAAPAPLGGQQRVPRRARRVRAAALGPVARRRLVEIDRAAGPRLVHRLPVPSGAQVAADAAASAVRRVHRRRAAAHGRGAPARPRRRSSPRSGADGLVASRGRAVPHRRALCARGRRAPARRRGARAARGARAGLPVCFKASFDKANRSARRAPRGPGLDEGLARARAGARRERAAGAHRRPRAGAGRAGAPRWSTCSRSRRSSAARPICSSPPGARAGR